MKGIYTSSSLLLEFTTKQCFIIFRASTSLRDVCGGRSVQDLIENREAISEELHEIIGPIAKSWGVKVKKYF